MKHAKVADCSLREWDLREEIMTDNIGNQKLSKNWFDAYFMKFFKQNVTVVFRPKTSNLDFTF